MSLWHLSRFSESVRQRLKRLLKKFLRYVNMWDKETHNSGMFLVDKNKRIAIARGLATNLSFDEPTSALDPETIGDVLVLCRILPKGHEHGVVTTNGLCPQADRIISWLKVSSCGYYGCGWFLWQSNWTSCCSILSKRLSITTLIVSKWMPNEAPMFFKKSYGILAISCL